MEALNPKLVRLVLLLAAAAVLSTGLSSCALQAPVFTRADSVFVQAGLAPRKIKASTLIMQTGAASQATVANNQKAGQRGGAAATAPEARATATTPKTALPWWVFALVGAASIAGWEWLSSRVAVAKWLPWRSKLD